MNENIPGAGDRPNYEYWRNEGAKWFEEYKRRMRLAPLYPIQTVIFSALFSTSTPMRVAEFGCGTGRHIAYLRKIDGLEVFGIDQSATMVDAIRKNTEYEWFVDHVFVVGPLAKLPFSDNYFDVVFTCEALIHVNPEDLGGRLQELLRVSRRGTFHMEPAPGYEIDLSAHCGSWNHDMVGAYRTIGYKAELLPKPCEPHQPVFCSKDGAWRPNLTDAFLSQCKMLEEVYSTRESHTAS